VCDCSLRKDARYEFLFSLSSGKFNRVLDTMEKNADYLIISSIQMS